MESLTIGSPETVDTLHIEGDPAVNDGEVVIYVEGDIIIAAGAELIIGDDTNVKLYFGGDLEAKKGSMITNENAPDTVSDPLTTAEQDAIEEAALSFELIGTPSSDTDRTLILKNSGDFYGAIYAPDHDIILHNGGNIYGGFIGNSLDMKNTGNFYYVAALYDFNDIEETYLDLQKGSWWEE